MQPVYIRAAELGGPFSGRPTDDLLTQVTRAGARALQAASIAPGEVEALYMAAMGGFEAEAFVGLLPLRVGNALKLRRADIIPMLAGTSEAGAWALRYAFEALRRGGEYKTVLIIAGEQMNPLQSAQAGSSRDALALMRKERNAIISQVLDDADRRYGLNMVRVGDLFMDILQHRLALDTHDLDDVLLPLLALTKYGRAARYPMAHFHSAPITTFEGYGRRGPITPHFNLHDVTPTTTGAVALVLSTDPGPNPIAVQIRGMGQAFVPISPSHRQGDIAISRAIREANRRAAASAQTSVEVLAQADFAILHDAFPSIELFFLSSFEFDLPTILDRLLSGWSNPFGGLKACGHALGASGMLQVAKAFHRFRRDPAYLEVAPGEDELPWERDTLCYTSSVGAALTNVIATVITCAQAPDAPDPLEALTPPDWRGALESYKGRTYEPTHYAQIFAHLKDDQGVVLGSTRILANAGFGDDTLPLLDHVHAPFVHLIQRNPASAGDEPKGLCYSDAPIPPGTVVDLVPTAIDGTTLHRAAPTEDPRISFVCPDPTDAHVGLWIDLERQLQRYKARPLLTFDAPETLTPHLLAYASIGDGLVREGLHLARLKARIVKPEGDTLPLMRGPLGRMVTVTLIHPTWQGVRQWLPILFEDCTARRDIKGPEALPCLYDWGVLPSATLPLNARRALELPDDTDSGATIYIVRQHIEGAPLSALLKSHKPPALDAFRADARLLGEAVMALHEADLFGHGVNLDHVVRSPTGKLYLLDSPWLELPNDTPAQALLPDPGERIARDIEGLGQVFFALYTGAPLPEGPLTPSTWGSTVRNGRLDVIRWLTRMLSRKGEDRFASVGAAMEVLEGFVG